MKKILFFVNKYDENDDLSGFFPSWIKELLNYLSSVIIITQKIGEYQPNPNLKVISLDKENNQSRLKRFWLFNKLLFDFRKDYDAVFVVMAPGWVISSFPLAKALGKKIFLWYAVWRGSWKLKFAEKLADKIFCSVQKAFPFETPKLFLLGQGVNTDRFVPNETRRRENKLLFLGRISPVKKIEVLLQALAELRRIDNSRFEKIGLDIVGDIAFDKDREYLSNLRRMAEELNLSDKINWKGRISHQEAVSYYQNSDLFVNLTPAGSFDKTALEAMACGNLVLVSNPAFNEYLGEKLSELILFKENDSFDLAKKMARILNIDAVARSEIRIQLREIIVKYHSQKQWALNLIKNLK